MAPPGIDSRSFEVSPVGSDPADGLIAAMFEGRLQVRAATWSISRAELAGPTVIGAVFGVVTADEASALVARLLTHDDPGYLAADLPWAAAVVRRDGTLAATASMMMASGLFVSESDDGQLRAAATDPVRTLAAVGRHRQPDWGFLRSFIVLRPPATGAPFEHVRRVTGGDTMRWRPGARRLDTVQWCGPETVPSPRRMPDLAGTYLATFDRVIERLVARAGPVSTTLSGGLDSGFMVASMARAIGGEGAIDAYCHTPLAGAAAPVGQWDPDDWPYASTVAAYLGPTVALHPLRNDRHAHPLDIALDLGRRRGWPVSAPGNAVWMDAFSRAAQGNGSRLRFYGTNGNAAFSYSHPYAGRYHLRRRQLPALWQLSDAGDPALARRLRTLRSRVLGGDAGAPALSASLTRWLRPDAQPDADTASDDGGRTRYLAWLTGRRNSLQAGENPAAYAGSLVADPFRARSVVEVAAAVEPAQWQRGFSDRALARRLSAGRLPEAVRLRRRRGGQAFDIRLLIERDPDRLMDSLVSTDAAVWANLGIDEGSLLADMRADLAGERELTHGGLLTVLRVAAVGEFVAA